ncbi:hypothetical protein [Microbacterium oxydans]|uniref:hypothetical protein n=1 Tax=Microbacterium oxydans TaxID=82380 RepID=UPI00226BA6F5|nr:hypothetical protein [Microbacterium oxydans]WAA67782.1 hypothetical protein MME74_08510 [Microbacterium oxydans]
MSKNITTATKALEAELEAGHQEQDDIAEYLASVDALIEQARAIKQLYKKEQAVEASRRSRAKRKAEVEDMKRRLAELEGA